ncbi:MAG TPA: hypothetical protein VGZ29_13710 [Terriglobia bacterium]|nr:hypothetical protein [Terriglobia bacterium]
MAKFTVLRPIEHNQILYVPQGAAGAARTKSAGNGGDIPVDASGAIELDAAAAETFTGSQVAPFSAGIPAAKRGKR